MQQVKQRVFVVNIGCRDHGVVRQAALTIDFGVQLPAEVLLRALPGRMHLGVAFALLVLGRTGRADDGGVHGGSGLEFETTGLQHLTDLGKQLLAQFVFIEQAAELQHRRGVRNRLLAQIDADESAQARAVVQRLLARQVSEVESMLDKVNAQHALQPDRRSAAHALGIKLLNHRAHVKHGTMVFMVLRNSSRRVGLRNCSNPEFWSAAMAWVCCFPLTQRIRTAFRGPFSANP